MWELDVMDRAVRIAMSRWRHLHADRTELYQAGWDGVTERLAGGPAELADLVRAADVAIAATRTAWARHHGYTPTGGSGSAPNFLRYWQRPAGGFEDALVERLALPQVLAPLPDHQRTALMARAAAEVPEAARMAGVAERTLRDNVRAGRRAVLALWMQHETPPQPARRQAMRRRAANVQPCGTPAAYVRHRQRREQACDDCRAAMADYERARRAA